MLPPPAGLPRRDSAHERDGRLPGLRGLVRFSLCGGGGERRWRLAEGRGTCDGRARFLFASLDASKLVAIMGARLTLHDSGFVEAGWDAVPDGVPSVEGGVRFG